MSKYLDLDDVVAGNPEAERELAELRQYVTRLRETISEIDAYAENLAVNREFKPISIADDLWQILDRHYSTPESEPDGETAIEASGWEHEQLPTEQELCDSLPLPESEPNGDDAREDIWMVERGMIPRWASKYTAPHTPEQEHGDALAALDSLQAAWYGSQRDRRIDTIRQALTERGVPESICTLPDKWFRRADDNALPYSEAKREQLRVDAGELRYEMQKALASAPAVPESTREAMPLIEGVLRAANHDALQHINREQLDRMYEWLMQQRAMIAAAPTDGRE